MEIRRVAVIAAISSISLAGMERDVRAQNHRRLPPGIGPAVTQEFREHGTEASPISTETSRSSVPKWSRVRLTDPLAAYATRRALDRAGALLAQPRCAAVLTDFEDREGRPLAERVSALGVDAQAYLELIVFIDGTRDELCTKGVMAFTAPGSRVVRLCATELTRTAQLWRDHVAVGLIHEMLHTLGLGENPPAPHEITRRVLDRCGLD